MKWFIRKFLTVLVIGILAVLASGCFGNYILSHAFEPRAGAVYFLRSLVIFILNTF